MTRSLLACLIALAAGAAEVAPAALPGGTGDPLALGALARLPVLHQGRVKPFAIAAEEIATSITSRADYALVIDASGGRTLGTVRIPATRLVFDWMAQPTAWRDQPVAWLPYIPMRERLHVPGQWASLAELVAGAAVLDAAVAKKQRIESTGTRIPWSADDEAAWQTGGRAEELAEACSGRAVSLLPLVSDAATESWVLERAWPLMEADTSGDTRAWHAVVRAAAAGDPARRAEALRRADPWLTAEDVVWRPDPLLAGAESPFAAALAAGARLRTAWGAGDASAIATATADLEHAMRTASMARVSWQRSHGAERIADYPSSDRIGWELSYQRTHPFRWGWIFYVVGGILAASGLASGATRGRLWRAGVIFTGLGCLFCAAGLAARGVIGGWGMVTNLYETLVYVSFLVGVFGLVLAATTRRPAYVVAAALAAALCALIGESTPPDLGRYIGQLQPVLRSRLWLTVHVLVVVASYAAFALALALGNWYLSRAAWHRKPVANDDAKAIYRCLQLGVVLIAAGTLLGGIWADQAWGRFWGWDPKEVFALVTLLTYLIPLHLRYVGAVGPTGLAAWSIYGFLSVVMSWYGVNFVLGAGLHAYATGSGFGSGGQLIVLPLCLLQIALAVWWHLRARAAEPAIAVPNQPAV